MRIFISKYSCKHTLALNVTHNYMTTGVQRGGNGNGDDDDDDDGVGSRTGPGLGSAF